MRPSKRRCIISLALLLGVEANLHDHAGGHHHQAARAYVASLAAQPTVMPLFERQAVEYDALAALNAAAMFSSNTQGPYMANPKTLSNRKTRTVPPTSTARPTATSSVKPSATPAKTISGTGTLPSATTFVTRNGTRLMLEGKTFRPIGSNIYWLGMDENVQPNPSYPSKSRVREALAMLVALGGNVARCMTCGVSTGNHLALQNGPNSFNDRAFDAIDYAIYAAGQYGVRLIIPLTDEYKYYHGGKYDFLNWAGGGTGNGYNFYTHSGTRTMFKTYIRKLLEHRNQFTGLRLADDPTIMAWETGNELGAYMLQNGAPPASWTKDIASFVKSIAPRHLVVDGSDGITNAGMQPIEGLNVDEVDIVSNHLYPLSNRLSENDVRLANQHGKVLYWGEIDWTDTHGGDSLASWLPLFERQPAAGVAIWSIFGRTDQCTGFVSHNDGYSLYYGSGQMTSNSLALAQTFHRAAGRSWPSSLNIVRCPQNALPQGGS